jgi:hypothetical protein
MVPRHSYSLPLFWFDFGFEIENYKSAGIPTANRMAHES